MANTFFPAGLIVKSPLLDTERIIRYSPGWEYDMQQGRKSERLFVGIKGFHTPHIQFGQAYYSSAFMLQGMPPKKTVCISYTFTDGIVNYRNETIPHGELIVFTRDEEIDLVLSETNEQFTITVEEQFFHQSFLAYFGRPFEETHRDKRLRLDPKSQRRFHDFLYGWVRRFVEYGKPEGSLVDYAAVEQEIIQSLFGFIYLEDVIRRENRILKQARELLHASLETDLKLTDTAAHLGISQRTLEYTFKHHLSMTPKTYLQLLRLYAVRDELAQSDPARTRVSDIALKYAFFHMGHFAAEYKKIFGESPVETLRHS